MKKPGVQIMRSRHAPKAGQTMDDVRAAVGLDPFTYARDHDAGPGCWCVLGPKGFKVVVNEKNIAFMVGKLLSGKTEEAAEMAKDFLGYLR